MHDKTGKLFGTLKSLGCSVRKYGIGVTAVGAASAVMSPVASAALADAVTTEMGVVKTDITAAGGLIIGLAATALGIRWVKATFF